LIIQNAAGKAASVQAVLAVRLVLAVLSLALFRQLPELIWLKLTRQNALIAELAFLPANTRHCLLLFNCSQTKNPASILMQDFLLQNFIYHSKTAEYSVFFNLGSFIPDFLSLIMNLYDYQALTVFLPLILYNQNIANNMTMSVTMVVCKFKILNIDTQKLFSTVNITTGLGWLLTLADESTATV